METIAENTEATCSTPDCEIQKLIAGIAARVRQRGQTVGAAVHEGELQALERQMIKNSPQVAVAALEMEAWTLVAELANRFAGVAPGLDRPVDVISSPPANGGSTRNVADAHRRLERGARAKADGGIGAIMSGNGVPPGDLLSVRDYALPHRPSRRSRFCKQVRKEC